MALTKDDLNEIETIVTRVVEGKITHAVSGLVTKSEFTEGLDRMESRLTTAIGLLQRDSYSRLDDHDARITRLERANSH